MVYPLIVFQASYIAPSVCWLLQRMAGQWFKYFAFHASNTHYLMIETVEFMGDI